MFESTARFVHCCLGIYCLSFGALPVNYGPRGSPRSYLDYNQTHYFYAFIDGALVRSSSDQIQVQFAIWIKPPKLPGNNIKIPRMSKLDVNKYLVHLRCFLEQSDILDWKLYSWGMERWWPMNHEVYLLREPQPRSILSSLCLWAFDKLPWAGPQSEHLTVFSLHKGREPGWKVLQASCPQGDLTAVSLGMSTGNGICPLISTLKYWLLQKELIPFQLLAEFPCQPAHPYKLSFILLHITWMIRLP